jgi:co-chaperonin GroES (HSP10)
MKKTSKIVGIKPTLSLVLVEHLTASDVNMSQLIVSDSTDYGSPQAYVLDLGPSFPEGAGIKVGDRVILQGTYVPVPNFDRNARERGLVEMHNIKAVLVEEKVG